MTLTIGDVADRSGLPATTLRYYESIGLVPEPQRSGNQRRYDDDVLDLLAVIRAAREAGFTLDEMRVLLDTIGCDGPGPAWRRLAAAKRAELLGQIERLERMLSLLDAISRCECDTVAECATRIEAAPAGSR